MVYQMMMLTEMIQMTDWIGWRRRCGHSGRLIPFVARMMMVLIEQCVCIRMIEMSSSRWWHRQIWWVTVRRCRRYAGQCVVAVARWFAAIRCHLWPFVGVWRHRRPFVTSCGHLTPFAAIRCHCCSRWWTSVGCRRTTVFRFYWQRCVWFHRIIITAQTKTIRWRWSLSATGYFAGRTCVVFAVGVVRMSWRLFTKASVNLLADRNGENSENQICGSS